MRPNFYLYTLGILCLWLFSLGSKAQSDYPTNSQIQQELERLAQAHPEAELKDLGKTPGGQTIWSLEIGKGEKYRKPATVVVGGVEGYHVLGVSLALNFAKQLLETTPSLLDNHTFYVLPNLSPDAYAQYHASLRYERRGNNAQVDHDRDGRISEDGYDDLNGDGMITRMRVESVVGDYVVSDEDERILRPIDRAKGERGTHLLFSEGIDNDKDGKINEDLAEGIAFNKSLTYQFPAFEPLAGDFPVSQPESRAVLDYLFDRANIYTVVTFGPANNLSSPLSYNPAAAQKRVVTSMLESDVQINKRLSDLYNEVMAQKPSLLETQGTPGDFFQWAYFHFGRLSLSTPGWWVPEMKTASGSSYKLAEANYLAWADSIGIPQPFVPWTEVAHPDFPGQRVEIGGLKPFLLHNPPFDFVDSLSRLHSDFILQVAAQHPKLEFHGLKVEKLERDLTRVSVQLINNAPLPTHTEMGKRSRWLQKIRVDVQVPASELLVGDKIQLFDSLEAYDKLELSWLVRGSEPIKIKAGAPHTGYAEITVKP
ncbi:hypothetical protein ADIS_2522 [Lunatimonas lonarensis]|uniref:Peptidase M14 domain-containing protein n=1 Tax=Lunatimonas lonarensis TaxID=1232681 RepID=R7ZSI8_9BACT|nr:M14 family metallopeptidase [Lunatimonas lonarensis]EON76979.1 hypothetical protein ADIS_2522 [Lunatimonas lonarensis]